VPKAPSIELKRHYRSLRPDEADAVVNAVAEMIVTFLKKPRTAGESRDGVISETTEEAKAGP
jgi:hypothetical protein